MARFRPDGTPKKFPWLGYAIALVIILLVGFWPLLLAMAASLLADAHGCTLSEGEIFPCMIMGADWGPVLAQSFVLGWFGLIFLPLGLIALVGWIFSFFINIVLYFRRKRPPVDPNI